MKKRFNFYILFIIIIVALLPTMVVKAVRYGSAHYGSKNGFNYSYLNECVNNNTCLLVCAYTNKVPFWTVNGDVYDYYSSYIYYDLKSGLFGVEWYDQHHVLRDAKHSLPLDNSSIFFGDNTRKELSANGSCPKNSFIDVGGLGSEVCFGSEDDDCPNKSNLGTSFDGNSTLEYNYEDHINTYFTNWFPTMNYSCEDYRSLKIDIKTGFVNDFSKNFLYGYEIPTFINKSKSFNSGITTIDFKIANLKSTCDAEVINNYNNGIISEDEKESKLNQNNQANDNLQNQIDEAVKLIKEGIYKYTPEIEPSSCESLLGIPTDPLTPAYYLTLVFKIIRYVAILLLIVLTVMDFMSALASHDDDEINKTMKKTFKRLLLCVLIFLLPILIQFILNILNNEAIENCINI